MEEKHHLHSNLEIFFFKYNFIKTFAFNALQKSTTLETSEAADFLQTKGRTDTSPNPASAEFFLTFNNNRLDLVSFCELGEILHFVLLKVCFKENYFHKQTVTTDKGSACTKGLKYRRTTRNTWTSLDCAFEKLPRETTVNTDREEGKTTCN